MPTILDRIIETKLREIKTSQRAVSEAVLERRVLDLPPTRDFTRALSQSAGIAVIAEVKKASPSAGVIRADFDPVAMRAFTILTAQLQSAC